jgi:hypothetical protein
MRVKNWSRAKGATCLFTLLIGGLFTNCSVCPEHSSTAVTVNPSVGDTTPVAACADIVNFTHYTGDPAMCDGSASALPGAPTGWQFPVTENMMRLCPDDGSGKIPANTPFNIYWTITSASDSVAESKDLVDYHLIVKRLDGTGGDKDFALKQPALTSCEWQDVGYAFNNGDPARALPPGTYSFHLTGIYDSSTTPKGWLATDPESITITQ